MADENATGDPKNGAGANGGALNGGANPPQRRQVGGINLAAFDKFKCVAEVDDGKGGRLMLQAAPRIGKVIRGRWELAKLGERIVDDRLKGLPGIIPGIVIVIDFGKRKITFTDPLTWASNKALLKEITKVLKEFYGVEQGPEKQLEYSPLNADQMKTWLYWMRRHLDAKQLKIHKGEVPEMEEIMRLPGRSATQPHDKNPKVMYQQSELPYLAPFQSGEETGFLGVDYESEMSSMFGGAES